MNIPSGNIENNDKLYQRNYHRRELPALLNAGYDFISLAEIMERRRGHSGELNQSFDPCSDTDSGDAIAYGLKGEVLLVLDAKPLREISEKTPLLNGAVRLNCEQWEDLKKNKNTLYLTEKQVEEADLEGFVYKNGIWQPKNEAVEMVWTHLSRGLNLKNYIQYVYEETRRILSWDYYEVGYLVHIMSLHFDHSEESFPTLRPWKLEYITSNLSAFTPIQLTNPLLIKKDKVTKTAEENKKVVKVVEKTNHGGIENVIQR